MDEDDLPPEHAAPVDLEPCPSCGRRFNPDTLARHKNICQKSKKKDANRKPFDMAKQRAIGTELEAFMSMKKYNQTPADRVKQLAYERQEQKKKQWKRRHEDFVETIRAAREYDVATKKGVTPPPPEPSAPNPDYVQCPYCKRRFQEHAAERHIPFCKEQSSRIERKTNTNSALNKRLKYRPPLPRKKGGMENVSYNSPGANIVQRKTNFSSTYTVDENVDYQTTGGRMSGQRSVEGAVPQTLPGSTPKAHKPHPPSKLAPPGVRSRMVHIKRAGQENPVQRNLPAPPEQPRYNGLTNGYSSSEHEEIEQHRQQNSPLIRRVKNVRAGRTGEAPRSGIPVRNNSLGTEDRSSSNDTEMQSIARAPHHRRYPEGNQSDSSGSLSNTNVTLSGQRTRPHPSQDHPPQSDPGFNTNSAGSRTKGLHLNAHGMSMSKFCYECGSGFPVPQAKYCCECGTKRI